MQTEYSLSLANPTPLHTSLRQKLALAAVAIGVLMCLIAWASPTAAQLLPPSVFLAMSISLVSMGSIAFVHEEYDNKPEGIKNHGVFFKSLVTRGVWGWFLGVLLTGFYVCLYWFPEYLTGLVTVFDPLSKMMRGRPADSWFVYGTIYTLSVLLMGYKFAMKYRHNRYQLVRTASVTFFQLGFSFLIPSFLVLMNEPEYYFSYFWPLKTDSLKPDGIQWIVQSSSHGLGLFFIGFSILMTFVGVPILTYFFGKRWYCSWVCGCGGLAETVGDPFRQLSDKSMTAWKIERWMIHSVLIFVTVMTVLLWVNSATKGQVLGSASMAFSKTYGFLIGSIFSGVIGTGFYPILGSRSWCRFGCPQAAILGIFQKKKSKFRITTNGGQCISCGNCSTYCEMGIDVRHYAQRGQDVVRASCVGCGICAAVCPRGVLRLENGGLDINERTEDVRAIHVKEGTLILDNF
ncbi:MAG: 4Fe-4S binding protein [Saprospiraceae bacterium]|nr:4Fe-4S binding protein [Saprospiraceae bacterium]